MKTLFPESTGKSATRTMRRGTKIAGFSLSSQFKEQLTELVNMINYSTPRYVRCIKPNKIGSADTNDYDDQTIND